MKRRAFLKAVASLPAVGLPLKLPLPIPVVTNQADKVTLAIAASLQATKETAAARVLTANFSKQLWPGLEKFFKESYEKP